MRGEGKAPFWVDRACDEGGLSTAGVVLALLVTLSMVFTGAQVYRVQSAAADIQEVADASALAADNVIAEYYLVARVCDAVVLSLSLTGIAVVGMGVAALCTPVSARAGLSLLQAGEKVLKARDAFAQRAARGLDKLQKALPFLAAAAAARVAAANRDAGGSPYLGFALACPAEGGGVSAGDAGAADSLMEGLDAAAHELQQAGERAEEAAARAREAKERAYRADCGANPSYCMYERAASLSGLSGEANPYFASADTWGFSVALERAKAYYPRRLAQEAPQGASVGEQANSALRKRFYRYAAQAVAAGHVLETDDSFEADFPLLPRNTAEMRTTPLFQEAAYPITANGSGEFEMHAWEGCPRAASPVGWGSPAQREAEAYAICPECRFTAASLGAVAAASSSIGNGFEYHYRIVAAAAGEYEEAKRAMEPQARKVRRLAGSLFQDAVSALRGMASQRLAVSPPGRLGVVAVVASTGSIPADAGFASAFVGDAGALGTRVAVSGATLVSDAPEQGRTVIASALDGLRERGASPLAGVPDAVMGVWSAMLFAYAEGQSRIGEAIDALDSRLSLDSESRLGLWSSREFEGLMAELGLQPAELDAPKPALVNSGRVLAADGGEFSARLMAVKHVASGLRGGNVLEGVVNGVEDRAIEGIRGIGDELAIAEIQIAGEGSPGIPITISLPDSARTGAVDLVSSVAGRLRDVAGDITGVRQWR